MSQIRRWPNNGEHCAVDTAALWVRAQKTVPINPMLCGCWPSVVDINTTLSHRFVGQFVGMH